MMDILKAQGANGNAPRRLTPGAQREDLSGALRDLQKGKLGGTWIFTVRP